MTDQMPRCSQIVGAHALYFPLLNAVLAKVAYAGLISFLDGDGWMRLGNSDERDVFGATASAISSIGNRCLNAKQVFTNGGLSHGLQFTFTVHSLQLTVRERKAYLRRRRGARKDIAFPVELSRVSLK